MALDRLALADDAAREVLLLVLIVRALDVGVGLEPRDHLFGRGPAADTDPVDALQRRQHLGPELLRKDRPAGALVDEFVGGDGDEQEVALTGRRLEVAHVAEMNQIEDAMGQHHIAALGLEAVSQGGQLVDRFDLVAGIGDQRRRAEVRSPVLL